MSVSLDNVQLAQTFRRGFLATFGLDLVTSGVGAATVVVLIRGLSVSSYAYVTLLLTFGQFAGAAASGGVRTRYLREEAERVSRGHARADPAAFTNALQKGSIAIGAAGLVAVPIAAAVGFGSGFSGSWLIVAAAGFAIGFSAVELAVAHYQARRRFAAAGTLRVLRALTLLAVSIGIVETSESTVSIATWLITSMVAVGAVTAGPLIRFGRARGLSRVSRFAGEELWLSFYYLAAAGFAYVDLMVAGALLDNQQVATLGASLRYLAVVLAAVPALGAVLRVRTSQVDVVDSPANQQALLMGWLKRALLPAVLTIGVAIALAPHVIPLIDGGRYPGSIRTLQIFLITALTAYLSAPVANVLMAQRRYTTLASIYAVGLALNLAGDIAVARPYGVVAIAIVSTSVYIAIDATMLVASLRYASRTSE
jgi:O-antigen/teichoic acid export membrane protein